MEIGGRKQILEGNNTHLKGSRRCKCVVIAGDMGCDVLSACFTSTQSLSHTHRRKKKKCFSSSGGKQTFITGTLTCLLCKQRYDLCIHHAPAAQVPACRDPYCGCLGILVFFVWRNASVEFSALKNGARAA